MELERSATKSKSRRKKELICNFPANHLQYFPSSYFEIFRKSIRSTHQNSVVFFFYCVQNNHCHSVCKQTADNYSSANDFKVPFVTKYGGQLIYLMTYWKHLICKDVLKKGVKTITTGEDRVGLPDGHIAPRRSEFIKQGCITDYEMG